MLQQKKTVKLLVVLGGGAVLAAIISLGILKDRLPSRSLPQLPSAPALPQKAITFNISSGKEASPKILNVTFDPFYVKEGEEQKLIVKTEGREKVKDVFAQAQDASGAKTISLQLQDCQEDFCLWQGSWQINLIKEKEYPIVFTAKSFQGEENSLTLFWQALQRGK